MEPVVISRRGCAALGRCARADALHVARAGAVLARTLGEWCAAFLVPAVRVEPRQSERLAILTALGLAVLTSTLSFGFIVGGTRPIPDEDDRPVPALRPSEGSVAGDETPPAMKEAGPSRHRRNPTPRRPPVEPARPPQAAALPAVGPGVGAATPAAAPGMGPAPPSSGLQASRLPLGDSNDPTPAAVAPAAGRNIRVRTAYGRTVVARIHGASGGELHVMLPDGQLGVPDRPVYTTEPFIPATAEEVERDLLAGPFAGFRVLQQPHYLIVYQSSEEFAQRSADVLEKLYTGLTRALRKFKLPVRDAEFPLVAVIFRTEADFRTHRAVDKEIQAYYQIDSNRIYFYEKSERDEQAPEVAALKRPQTVAHEGTHQILQNVGVHPRLAPWPAWLVEGLAEYCATPVTTKKGTSWSSLGVPNAFHLATIRDLDDPLSGQVAGSTRPEHIGRKPGMPLVEYLVTKTELTPTDYALSWGMTHYLARRRTDDFVAYLRSMSDLAPLSKLAPSEQLDAFRRAFGHDLGRLDREVGLHLAKLKVGNHLPYYAVRFQQRIGGGLVRRAAIVSQSPSMIRQWLETVSTSRGDSPVWEAYPYPHRTPALAAAEDWLRGP